MCDQSPDPNQPNLTNEPFTAPLLLHRAAEIQLRGVPRQVLQEQLPSQTRRVAPILLAARTRKYNELAFD